MLQSSKVGEAGSEGPSFLELFKAWFMAFVQFVAVLWSHGSSFLADLVQGCWG